MGAGRIGARVMITTTDNQADKIPSRTVSEAELRQFVEAIGLERVASGRCSRAFMFHIYCLHIVPTLPGDPIKIVAEVQGLESNVEKFGTKPAEQFQHPPLRGLWKKHYLVGGMPSLVKNIKPAFGKKNRELRRIIEENHNPSTAHLSPQQISESLASAVTNLYAERANDQKLTGEWIIVAKHEEKNYYLCLAQHNEDDAAIFERARSCAAEFSFLLK
jgi:hypothetical protein